MTNRLILTVIIFAGSVSAQTPDTSGWQTTVDASVAAAQAAYSENWEGEETGSLAWNFNSSSEAKKQLAPAFNWKNTLKLAFGQIHSQTLNSNDERVWEKPKKSNDLIDLETVGSFTLNGFVDPYVAGRLETQFTDASVPSLRRYFTPLRLTESAGILRVLINRPKELELTTRLGFAVRQQFIVNIIDTLAGTTERDVFSDGGAESVTDLKVQFRENLTYTSKLTLFKAFFFSEEETALNDDWKQIDANWEHIFSAAITKIIQTNLYLQLLFDEQIDSNVRIKETLGLGIAVKFSR